MPALCYSLRPSRGPYVQPTNRRSADSHVIRYRADLDGMRAIAVTAVVIFHLAKEWLPGGFLGVDLFFVLSGFLITSIIWTEIGNGNFSIGRFYERRVRRIMPALLVLLVPVTLVASLLLLPSDLVGYGKSLLATLTFVANIYFWRDTNYFSPLAETKPLLHVWSLGVEEQYYIFFPILLLLMARYWRRGVFPVVALLTLASFLLNYVAVVKVASAAAFFLLPTRIWELGAGALLGLWPYRSEPLKFRAGQYLAPAGLILIANGLFRLAATSVFSPSLSVVAGTVLLIVAGRDSSNPVSRLLSQRYLTALGLISYSLYLWHWPIIVLAKYYLARPLRPTEIVLAVVLMVGTSYVSWRYIEAPFRRKSMPIKKVLAIVATVVTSLFAVGAALVLGRGFPQRLNARATVLNNAVGTSFRCPVQDFIAFGSSRACAYALPSRNFADARFALVGNSHVAMYAPVWKQIFAERGLQGLIVPLNGCLPTPTVNLSPRCATAAKLNLDATLALPHVRIVVIGTTWEYGPNDLTNATGQRVDNRADVALQQGLDTLIDRLRKAGKIVVLVGPLPKPGWQVASVLSRDIRFHRTPEQPLEVPAGAFEAQYAAVITHFAHRPDIGFALPHREICDRVACHYVIGGRSIFADDNHLALAEIWRFRPEFEATLDHALSIKQRR